MNLGLSLSLGGMRVGGGASSSLSRIMPDGTTAWYTDQRGIVINGNLFYSTSSGTTSRGSIEIVRVAPDGKTTIWNVLPYAEVDDHNNASFVQLSDGRLMAFYSTHTDTRGTHYRVSNEPAPDIKGWGPDKQIAPDATKTTSYSHPFLLNDGKVYMFRRHNSDDATGRPHEMCSATESSILAGTETWAKEKVFKRDGQRPYPKLVQNGADRVDIFTSNGSPSEVSDCGLYAGYCQLDAGTMKFYTSAGVEITAARPFDVQANFTEVQVPTATNINESWTYDATVGSDGHLRGLSMRYPTSGGGIDNEYWHHRWTGSAWVNTRLAEDVRNVYVGQPYVPGLVFDKRDATVIYMGLNQTDSELVTVGKYAFDEGTGAITLTQTIATDLNDAMRFHSPPGNTGDFELTFNYGAYESFDDFEMDAWLYGTVSVVQPTSPLSYLAETDALVARMSVAPSTARKDAIDRYIGKLKAGAISGSDIWAKVAGLYLLAAHDAQAAQLNWKGASNDLTLVGTPTFVANSHATGNSTNYFVGPAPNAIGSPYTQNSAFLAAHYGKSGGSNYGTNIIRRIAVGSPTLLSGTLSRINANGGTAVSGYIPDGSYIAVRESSTALKTYRNGTLQRTESVTSAALDADALVVCYEALEAQMVAWGGALTADEAMDFNIATWEYIREVVAPQNTTP
jgi:hypothetical protein